MIELLFHFFFTLVNILMYIDEYCTLDANYWKDIPPHP